MVKKKKNQPTNEKITGTIVTQDQNGNIVRQEIQQTPTVQSNISNSSVPKNNNSFFKNTIDTTKYYGKSLGSGALNGITGIADAGLQEVQNSLQKGEKIKTKKDLTKHTIKTLAEALNPSLRTINSSNDTSKELKKIWKDKKASILSKIVNSGLTMVTNGANSSSVFKPVKDSLTGLGATNHNLDEKVADIQKTIDKPSENLAQSVAQDSQNHSNLANTISGGLQSTGNMAPALATTVLTKNPCVLW